MGGRYVIIKSILESQLVYCMALAHISSTVLNWICQLVFSFLWSGSKQKQNYHLCRWETLARPKKYGGSRLRNIFYFYRALATNTLWRVLMKDGIWHRVIKDKYLPHGSVMAWLGSTSSATTQGCRIGETSLNFYILFYTG